MEAPPATSTVPSSRRVAVAMARGVLRLPVSSQVSSHGAAVLAPRLEVSGLLHARMASENAPVTALKLRTIWSPPASETRTTLTVYNAVMAFHELPGFGTRAGGWFRAPG